MYMCKGGCIVDTFHLFRKCSERLYLLSQGREARELPCFLIFHRGICVSSRVVATYIHCVCVVCVCAGVCVCVYIKV